MSEARLPVAVTGSLMLHAGLILGYLHFASMNAKQQARMIANVDLLIKVRKTPVPGALNKPPPPSTFDFLKLALPALPKMELKAVAVKAPEIKRTLTPMTPKLDDRGKRQDLQKLEALDLDSKRPDMAKIDAKVETRKSATLAALPRLEEVGRRQVRNLPQALAIEERRREAVEIKRMEAMGVAPGRHVPTAMEALQEAAPAQRSRFAEKMAAILPTQEERTFQPEARAAPEAIDRKLNKFIAPPLEHPRESAAPAEKKKSVEIEGPLADRKIVSYVVPAFPDWARSQGILEASVAIRFYVDKAGSVVPGQMRVERTSGYGRLDRLAMDALKDWKFAPLAVEQRQWGIITFTFVLE